MTEIRPIEPEKESAPRFHVFGPVGDPANWLILDRQSADPDSILASAIAFVPTSWDKAEERATRVAYALNTIGRLLGDPGAPYYIEEVERLADALGTVAAESTKRAMQAMSMGETPTALMFGAEARAIGAGGDTIRRMLAELLKFALVGDTIDDQAQAWLDRAYPTLTASTFDTLTAADFMGRLLDAYRKGAIAGMTRGVDVDRVIEIVTRDVAELGDRTSPEDWPEAMIVTGEELAMIVGRALGRE